MNKEKATRRLKAAIEMLDAAAANLSIDDPIRKRVVLKRQDVEDLLSELESK